MRREKAERTRVHDVVRAAARAHPLYAYADEQDVFGRGELWQVATRWRLAPPESSWHIQCAANWEDRDSGLNAVA
jgi:hypothetical protein